MSLDLPPPHDLDRRPGDLLAELTSHVTESQAALWCADLLSGADPHDHADLLPYLAGRPAREFLAPGQTSWQPYWPRAWGARALLYVWDDAVAGAVVAGVRDDVWRVAEHCLKVARRHDLPAADDAVPLLDHDLPRVRVAALRALGRCGETEHLDAVRRCADDPDDGVREAAAAALEEVAARLDRPADPADRDPTRG